MTDCDCVSWATDLRVGYPNGHHPCCPQQPHPSRTVELVCANEFLTEILKLPGGVVLDAMVSWALNEQGNIKFQVNMPDAPEHAVSMEPIHTRRRWPDGRHRDVYLSGITWCLADGSRQEQTFEAPVDDKLYDYQEPRRG